MLPMTTSDVQEKTSQDAATARRQRLRSLAIALGLGFLVIMFYAATIVRLGGSVLDRPL